MERCTRVHARNILRWAEHRPDVLVLSADLTSSTEIDLFRDAYPERFFSLGIAEQNMISFAGGLAREGFTPFVHTFGVFIYRRAYDQIAISVAYPNLPVKLFGFLPGILTPGGATHQAIEDIAVMRALPNMTVLECGDATDVEGILDIVHEIPGPVYVRMLRGEIPRLFHTPIELGKARVLQRGRDIAVISSGICTEEAARAVAAMSKRGVSLSHLHVSTLKPFDDPEILEVVSRAARGVVSMENHTIIGGLGSAVADVMAARGVGLPLIKLGLRDSFAHGASRAYLAREYGMDASALVGACEKLLQEPLSIGLNDLSGTSAGGCGKEQGQGKAEDL